MAPFLQEGIARPLPSNLLEATWLFRESAFARKAFGDKFVDHYHLKPSARAAYSVRGSRE